ncbi:RpiB/LacA/LacB family sugar-phosphate isomerase [bacterium]|nr:RpiB/LacA/LacB family sugar-phosphate isomerase [bacterium]
MEIHLGSDHRGFELKQRALEYLSDLGHSCTDHGALGEERSDYPGFARAVGEAVAAAPGSLGLVFCGSGIGISIAANKVQGIRCAVAWCEHVSEYGRRHNHANCLAFGADVQTWVEVERCLNAYLGASEEEGRHALRVQMVQEMDGIR